MDASQNSGQNDGKKNQLSWSQPLTTPTAKPVQSSTPASPATKNVLKPKTKEAEERSRAKRNFGIAAVVIVVLLGVAWVLTEKNKSSTDATVPSSTATSTSGTALKPGTPSTTTAQASFPSGSLVITSPQTAGLSIAVSNAVVEVPTWVVIYENFNGQPGNVLGAGLFVKGRTSGAIDLLRGTLPGQTYFAGEARDNGDHMFSMVNDMAIRDMAGNPIVLKFETK